MTTTTPMRASQGLAYGLLGLPLAFVALPLYVLLPNHYAREFGMPLATLGSVLLAARLFDSVSDPLLAACRTTCLAARCVPCWWWARYRPWCWHWG